MGEKVGLIEPDDALRSHLLGALSSGGIHAEPFEGLAEFMLFRGKSGYAALVDDDRVDALAVRKELSRQGEWLAVVAFSESPTIRRAVDVVRGGGYDYFALPLDFGALSQSLADLKQGSGDYASARRRAAAARTRLASLSPREAEVLACMADGRSNKAIGIDLGISPRTVEIHRANMLSKLSAQSSTEALRMFHEDALLNGEAALPGGG